MGGEVSWLLDEPFVRGGASMITEETRVETDSATDSVDFRENFGALQSLKGVGRVRRREDLVNVVKYC